MQRQGFIFSLDAFVAFTLIMITISLLIFLIGTPKPFYPSLEQAHMLAYDTLTVLATSTNGQGNPTYLEQIMNEGQSATTDEIMRKVAGGAANHSPIIPYGYGFRLEKLVFNADGSAVVSKVLYNSSSDTASDRYGKQFTKLQTSATTFMSIYSVPRRPGESPFCYLNCRGYDGGGSYLSTCDKTPCNVSKSNFESGESEVVLVQLVVFT
ncbi:MAG: hypothetical protein QW568_01375 [Candidatus Anstonellaceae archaeon]